MRAPSRAQPQACAISRTCERHLAHTPRRAPFHAHASTISRTPPDVRHFTHMRAPSRAHHRTCAISRTSTISRTPPDVRHFAHIRAPSRAHPQMCAISRTCEHHLAHTPRRAPFRAPPGRAPFRAHTSTISRTLLDVRHFAHIRAPSRAHSRACAISRTMRAPSRAHPWMCAISRTYEHHLAHTAGRAPFRARTSTISRTKPETSQKQPFHSGRDLGVLGRLACPYEHLPSHQKAPEPEQPEDC